MAHTDMQASPTVLETVETIVTIGAILAGGFWTYYKFFKGRTFRPRLEPEISGRFFRDGGHTYLIPAARLKNVGLSEVPIQQRGSGIRVSTCPRGANVPTGSAVQWEVVRVYPVFEAHRWVEPGEVIEDEGTMVSVSPGVAAFKLELRVVGKKKEWNTEAIVPNIETEKQKAEHSL